MNRTLGLCVGALLVVPFLFASLPAWSQNAGSLQGQVTDPSGAAVAKANVTATDLADGTTRSVQTDSAGSYSFGQLRPGTYKVEVTKEGFRTAVQGQVNVLVSTPGRLDFHLEIGAVNQTVLVVSEAPALNTSDATVGNPFDEREIESLPFLARNVVNLLTLQPGVVFTGLSDTDLLSMGTMQSLDLREGSVDGVRSNQTNVTVDGVDSNDWQNQSPFTSALPVTLDSVEEFRVTTTNANATDGLVGGPQVALVTKSGSNSFHGNVRWYYRTSGTAANQFFNNQAGVPRPKLQRNIPGASLGGPIKKDRAFFFLDTEERREISSEPVTPRQVPTDALRDGVLVYQCKTASQCPGMTVQGLTAAHVVPAGAFGLTPAQFKSLDPAGLGVNPAMISVLSLYPHGNSPAQGNDLGLSFNGFSFNSPIIRNTAVQTARMDYKVTADGRHSIFTRAEIGDYHVDLLDAQFPGQSAASKLLNNSKGIAVQYQGQLTPNLVETARYGFSRLGVEETGAPGTSFRIRSFDNLMPSNASAAAVRDTSHRVPVHEVGDDVTWTRGVHTIQMGGVLRFIRNQRIDFANSFFDFDINNGFCVSLCSDMVTAIGNGTTFPAVGNPTLFERAMMGLTGSISQITATFLANPKAGSLLPAGSPELRSFRENNYEVYAQDSWRLKPNLTFTYGLRYGYETPPWEDNGVQVTPTVDIMQWFQQRVRNMNAGIPSNASPLLKWALAGKVNNRNSWYNPYGKGFAPRLALAYSPDFSSGIGHALFGDAGKTSLRVGGGLFYDRIGQAIAIDSDLNGSPGTATQLINSSQQFDLATAPRFSGSCNAVGNCTNLPTLSTIFSSIPTKATFPFTPVANASNLGFAVDQNLRTPYSFHLTASIQRQLPKNVVVDVAYVGTLGRRQLGKIDYAQYLNLRDRKSGVDLWTAFQKVVNIIGTPGNPSIPPLDSSGEPNVAGLSKIAAIPYFENMVPNMGAFTAGFFCAAGDTTCVTRTESLTPTQAFYAFVTQDTTASWSCALFPMDTAVGPGGLPSPWNTTVDPNGTGFVLFQQQFSSLPGWTNFANSNYHSMQVSVRKNAGFATFGFNYVFSHSIDNASGSENGDNNPSPNSSGTLNSLIQNPFNLRFGRATSDFDLRHNFNAYWVLALPFGKGKKFGTDSGRLMDLLIGGWEVSGLTRWHSGFPQTPGNGFNFPTNFFLTTPGTLTQPISTHVVRNGQNGLPNLFKNAAAALAAVSFTGPGLPGSRNVWGGPAYADFDAGVTKNIRMPWSENQRMQLRVTAFNVFNNVNFSDSSPFSLDPTIPNTFGQFVATAGPRGGAREMEFSVRYEF